jgi:hypothetical protein
MPARSLLVESTNLKDCLLEFSRESLLKFLTGGSGVKKRRGVNTET